MHRKFKREDGTTFRSFFCGSARNGAHVDAGENNDASISAVSSKMSIGTFGVNQVPTNFNQNLFNHVNEVSPDKT